MLKSPDQQYNSLRWQILNSKNKQTQSNIKPKLTTEDLRYTCVQKSGVFIDVLNCKK